jgi:uncharacterized protein (UPF0276 family)
MADSPRPQPVGIGWRKELGSELFAKPRLVSFVEVVAEACIADPQMKREVLGIREVHPVVAHGVKLSLGSAEGMDVGHAARLAAVARELRAPYVSEHVAFVRAGQTEIGHLTPLPRTSEAVTVVARNADRMKRVLRDRPLLLENVACTFFWPDDAMTEGEFYWEISERTGCELLLDLGNLYANALNRGLDPMRELLSFPLERVAMAHLAGGVHLDGFYMDTHAHAVPEAVFELAAVLRKVKPSCAMMIERDAHFEAFDMEGELDRLRAPSESKVVESFEQPRHERGTFVVRRGASAPLAKAQAELALQLTGLEAPSGPLAESIGHHDLARTRHVLQEKRIDEALPLLSRLSNVSGIRSFAESVIEKAPRARARAAYADAFRIVEAARAHEGFAAEAAMDALLLRARVEPSSYLPRRGPFIGIERVGRAVHVALKSFGVSSNVYLWSSNRHARHSPRLHPRRAR